MFIADIHTLQTVYTLNLAEHVVLSGADALDPQDVMRIHTTFCQLIAGFQDLPVRDLDTGSVGDQVCLGVAVFRIGNDDLTFLLSVVDHSDAGDLSDDRKTFRLTRLKKLLHTRKTLCDIAAGNTAGMEGTHGKLCTGLADRLSRDDTYGLAHLYRLACSHVRAVALRADAHFTFTCKNGTDLHLINRAALCVHAFFHDTGRTLRCDHMVGLHDNLAVFIGDGLAGKSSCNTLLKAFDLLFAVHKAFYIHTGNLVSVLAAVCLADDQFLGDIDHSSCQITGVGCTESRIGQTFTRSMSGHEVFQYVQTFTEVGLNGKLDGMTGSIGHKSTHTRKLFDLLIGTTGSGVSHHEDVIIFIKTVQKSSCQLVVRLLPGFHDLFVTLFLGDQTTLVVLGNLIYDILGVLDHLRLLRRHGHIGNGYCHCRACGIFISGSLDRIQNLCGLGSAVCVDDFFQDLL